MESTTEIDGYWDLGKRSTSCTVAIGTTFLNSFFKFYFLFFLFLRYVSQGGDAALEENEARLREVAERAENLKREKDVVSNEIDKLKEDIAKQQVRANRP